MRCIYENLCPNPMAQSQTPYAATPQAKHARPSYEDKMLLLLARIPAPLGNFEAMGYPNNWEQNAAEVVAAGAWRTSLQARESQNCGSSWFATIHAFCGHSTLCR